MVVFITSFAVFSLNISALLAAVVLSPVIGRLSDVLDRKYLAGASVPPLIALVGAVLSAKAQSMVILIIGGVLIGTTLSTISVVHAISSEILPLKYRALANGLGFIAGSFGGLVGSVGSGAVTDINPSGWRNIFWMQVAFHGMTSVGLLGFYWPPPSNYPHLKLRQLIWACDPISSLLMTVGVTLLLLGFNWAGGTFPWGDTQVIGPLVSGAILLLFNFELYEWKGRTDGIIAHVLFSRGPNFALSVFTFGVEGFVYYSAVNSIVPQIILNLGFETNAWDISVRQASFQISAIIASIPIMCYKDLKSPLLVTFSVCYATITPKLNHAQIGYNILSGIGQSGPLSLVVALTQLTAPHEYLSTATGIAFSARAIGGVGQRHAFYCSGCYGRDYAATTAASRNAYGAHTACMDPNNTVRYRGDGLFAFECLKGVADLMTEHVEATVERQKELTPMSSDERRLERVCRGTSLKLVQHFLRRVCIV
ncbi:MFS general substrate transporter [Mycena olivaceomarginata]|nr:MFS general substrate transporter [Mycena olivaceomarginata]